MTILIAAGHEPKRPGAVHLGFAEHPEACLWRDAIVSSGNALFEAVPVGTLVEKVLYINRRCAESGHSIALEVHFNAGGTPGKTRGCETLYAPGSKKGVIVAQYVQDALAPLFPPSRGVKEAWYRMDHPHRVDFPGDVPGDEKPDYFCVRTVCPAVIVEPEFIYEREGIQSKRDAACAAIADALAEAYRSLYETQR